MQSRNNDNRLYVMWNNMKSRCNNPNNQDFHSYGGRGIKLCNDWHNNSLKFMNWALSNGYSDDLSIERIDVNGNYEPKNCKFIPMVDQALNRGTRVDNKFGENGINYDERKNKYIVRVTINRERCYVGAYDTIQEAKQSKRNYMSNSIANGIMNQLKQDEGFSEYPYKCTMNKLSIGYGTNIEDGISEEEGELLLKYRLNKKIGHLLQEKPIVFRLPQEKQEVLFNMSYQLGVNGVLKFKRMWASLEDGFNYNKAADEMLDSKWYEQTPSRAKKLSEIMRA